MYNKYKNISKSPFFNIRKNTKLLYTPISSDFSKTTIYLAFIKFCKFNTGIELPENLKRLCISNTCNYNKFDSIEEKIISMENDNLIYNKESLNILLNIINRQNILEYDIDPPITTEKLHFEETLQFLLEKQNLNICDKDLLQKFKVLVDRFDVSLVEDDVAVLDLKQHINQINQKMATNLKEKMSTILTRKNKDILFEYFPVGDESDKSINSKKKKFILNWNQDRNNHYMSNYDDIGFTIFNMIKEIVTLICKVYPTIILNKINYNNRYVPKHWLKGSKKFKKT